MAWHTSSSPYLYLPPYVDGLGPQRVLPFHPALPLLISMYKSRKGGPRGGGERRSGCSADRVAQKTPLLCCQRPRPSSTQAPVCVCVVCTQVSFLGPSKSQRSFGPLGLPAQRPQGTITTAGAGTNRFSRAWAGVSGGFCADPWRRGRLLSVPNLARFESETTGVRAAVLAIGGGLVRTTDRNQAISGPRKAPNSNHGSGRQSLQSMRRRHFFQAC